MPDCVASIQMGSGARMSELFPSVLTIILVDFLFALLKGWYACCRQSIYIECWVSSVFVDNCALSLPLYSTR